MTCRQRINPARTESERLHRIAAGWRALGMNNLAWEYERRARAASRSRPTFEGPAEVVRPAPKREGE